MRFLYIMQWLVLIAAVWANIQGNPVAALWALAAVVALMIAAHEQDRAEEWKRDWHELYAKANPRHPDVPGNWSN